MLLSPTAASVATGSTSTPAAAPAPVPNPIEVLTQWGQVLAKYPELITLGIAVVTNPQVIALLDTLGKAFAEFYNARQNPK